jgi:hypothetical protein
MMMSKTCPLCYLQGGGDFFWIPKASSYSQAGQAPPLKAILFLSQKLYQESTRNQKAFLLGYHLML